MRRGKHYQSHYCRLKWIDPKLAFHNLKNDTVRNTLKSQEAARIWTPIIIVDNIRAGFKAFLSFFTNLVLSVVL